MADHQLTEAQEKAKVAELADGETVAEHGGKRHTDQTSDPVTK